MKIFTHIFLLFLTFIFTTEASNAYDFNYVINNELPRQYSNVSNINNYEFKKNPKILIQNKVL